MTINPDSKCAGCSNCIIRPDGQVDYLCVDNCMESRLMCPLFSPRKADPSHGGDVMSWTVVSDTFSKDFEADSVADARHKAFNILVGAQCIKGILQKNKNGSRADLCQISVRHGTYRPAGSDTDKQICHKLTLAYDDDWVLIDAGLVDYENFEAFCRFFDVPIEDYDTEAPAMYWCRTYVDEDRVGYYVFFETQEKRTFPVWVCYRKVKV